MKLPVYIVSQCLFLILFLSIEHCWCYFNFDETKSITYNVDLLSTPVKSGRDLPALSISMTSKYGQQYVCSLPQIVFDEEMKGSDEPIEDILDAKLLLKPLTVSSCLLKTKDWWTYELCPGRDMRQYHLEDGQISGQVITLGVYDSDYDWNNKSNLEGKSKNRQQRYHSQYYSNGSMCDLTGDFRKTEIRYFCEEESGDYIARVDEPETCHYVVTVYTSHICNHKYLKPLPASRPHQISCNPLLTEEQYALYEKVVEEKKQAAEAKKKAWIEQQQEILKALKERKEETMKATEAKSVKTEEDILSNPDPLPSEETKAEEPHQEEIVVKVEENSASVAKEEPTDESKPTEKDTANKDAADLISKILDDSFNKGTDENNLPNVAKSVSEYRKAFKQEFLKQFDTIFGEVEQELQADAEGNNQDEQLAKLSSTLNKLLEKLEQVENKNKAPPTGEDIEDEKLASEMKGLTEDEFSDDLLEDELDEDEEETDEVFDEKVTSSLKASAEEVAKESQDKPSDSVDDGKVRVRIRKIDRSELPGKLRTLKEHELSQGQKQRLEEAVMKKLEKAGLDTSGRKIEVKIITAGYDGNDGGALQELTDEEAQKFQSMILNLLNGNQEAAMEMERQSRMEKSYNFRWKEDGTLEDDDEHES